MTEPKWLDEFRGPPAAYGHMMFWIWNGEVTEERITEMLEQFAERGIGGVLVHPRSGFITEYLSDRWWELWEHSLKECIRLGMECHIYDEDGFPSGTAGGLTLEAVPDAAARVLMPTVHTEAPAEAGDNVVAILRRRKGEGGLEHIPLGADLAHAVQAGPIITISLSGRSGRRGGYPDLCLPESTQTFLRLTHDEYAKRLSAHFGKEIKYVFTDEPGVQCRRGLVWSEYLHREFRQEHGYDLAEKLDAFLTDDENARAVRFDYWQTVNRLWLHSFCKGNYDWCEAHGLAFTGHYNEHEWPRPETVPDAMAGERWMQVPGIDMLAFQFDPSDRLKNSFWLLTAKEVASVANQVGAERVFCESYGGGGYEMAIPQFKPLSDWLLACGINVINPHLSHEAIAGSRKYDWPQTISDHASWWPCYGIQARHDARLTVAATRGRERNRVLLLQPTLTGWLYYIPRGWRLEGGPTGDEALDRMKESQSAIVQALADGQVDFDLGDELIMAEMGKVEGSELVIGQGRYSAVVLPENMETWQESTLELMRSFLEAGGRLLAAGSPPALLGGRPSRRPVELRDAHPDGWTEFESLPELVAAVRDLVPRRVSRPDGSPLPPEFVYYRRECKDGEAVHIFVNPWLDPVAAEVRLEGASVLALDTMTGESRAIATRKVEGGQVVELSLPPAGHAVFVSLPEPVRVEPVLASPERVVALGDLSARRLEANVLALDYCDVHVKGTQGVSVDVDAHAINTTHANRLAWQAMGFDRCPWHGMQFKRELIDRTFPAGTYVDLRYRFTIDPDAFDAARGSIELAVERPWLYELELNGHSFEFPEGSQWWDEDIRRTSVARLLQPGENVLRMLARPFRVLCEIAPVYVHGDFGVRRASPGFVIDGPGDLALGDWLEQGLLFYPWGARYWAPFTLDREASGITVRVPEWKGSAIRVLVDADEAGVIAYPPHELRVECPLAEGDHELAVDVFGNMKNLLGPPFDDGLPGIWTWERHPEHAPDGDAYRFFSCGLMAAPVLRVW